MQAAAHNRQDVCQILLECNAKPSIKDAYGNTPIDEARKAGHMDVLKLLMGYLNSDGNTRAMSPELPKVIENGENSSANQAGVNNT